MDKLALLVLLDARPGKETAVEEFLKSAQPLVLQEAGTTNWYACRVGPRTFAIFDTFVDKDGRNAHLNGEVAKALFAAAEELFATPPRVEMLEILASKTS